MLMFFGTILTFFGYIWIVLLFYEFLFFSRDAPNANAQWARLTSCSCCPEEMDVSFHSHPFTMTVFSCSRGGVGPWRRATSCSSASAAHSALPHSCPTYAGATARGGAEECVAPFGEFKSTFELHALEVLYLRASVPLGGGPPSIPVFAVRID